MTPPSLGTQMIISAVNHSSPPPTQGTAASCLSSCLSEWKGENFSNNDKRSLLSQLVQKSKSGNFPSFENRRVRRSDHSDRSEHLRMLRKQQVLTYLRADIENNSLNGEIKTVLKLMIDVLDHLVDVERKSHFNYWAGLPEIPEANWETVGRQLASLSVNINRASQANHYSSAKEEILTESRLIFSKLARQAQLFHNALKSSTWTSNQRRQIPPEERQERVRATLQIHRNVNQQMQELGTAITSLSERMQESGEFSGTEKVLLTRLLDEVKKIQEFLKSRTDYSVSSQ